MSNETSLETWDQVDAVEVSTAELDAKVKQMQDEWADYEAKKKIATEAHTKYEETERYVLALLKAAKKSKYVVEGLGTVSVANRFVVRTPKSIESKKLLFDYIRERHGSEGLIGLVSINHQTLQSFINEEKKVDPLVQIPGLEAPTSEESLRFRSERK